MTKDMFWDRKKELASLKEIHAGTHAAFIKLYGRRRIGKTELIRHFLEQCGKGTALYYYVDKAEDTVLMQTMADAIRHQLGETLNLSNWDDLFTYLANKSKQRFVLVIDEAPRFMDNKSVFLTRLQHVWDTSLKDSKLMLVIVGSSISMMEKMTSHNGPLYGRLTHDIKLSPFRYVDFREVFKEKSEQDILQYYAVFGGTPHYVRMANLEGKKLNDTIMSLLVHPEAALSREAEDLFEIEGVREPARYVTILKAIAQGNLRLPEIANATGIQIEQLPIYLKKLHDRLDLIEPADPIGGKKKNARYDVSDNFFRFWYRFIFPHRSAIEVGNTKDIKQLIDDQLPALTGRVFERVVRELFVLYQGREILGIPIQFDSIGSWWPARGEQGSDNGDIDVVARHEKTRTTYVADVKHTNSEYGFTEFNTLQQRIKKLPFGGQVRLFTVSRSGFTTEFKNYAKQNNIILISIEQLSELFDKAHVQKTGGGTY